MLCLLNIKWRSFDIFGSHFLLYIVSESIGKSIWSNSSKQKDSMEQSNVLDGLWKITFLWLFITVPLLIEMRLTLHLVSNLFEYLNLLESLNNRPSSFWNKVQAIRLMRRISSDFFLDQMINFVLCKSTIIRQNSECQHCSKSKLVLLKGTSSGVVECLVGD